MLKMQSSARRKAYITAMKLLMSGQPVKYIARRT